MPLYEDKHNAENIIKVSQATKDAAVFGTDKVVKFIAEKIQSAKTVAIDGWYGVDYKAIIAMIAAEVKDCEFVDASTLYLSKEELENVLIPAAERE